jgi:hypothetical protein
MDELLYRRIIAGEIDGYVNDPLVNKLERIQNKLRSNLICFCSVHGDNAYRRYLAQSC